MIKAFNSIKEILLVFYQVLFVEAKERYEITEFYLEKCGHNKKVRNLIKNDRRTENSSPYEKLTKEKARLEKTIQHLEERLEIVSEILSGM